MNRALILIIASVLGRGQNLADVVKRGETVFASTCAVGSRIEGLRCKRAPSRRPRLRPKLYCSTVARGVSGTAMPSFASTLPRPDFAAVVAYLATLNGVPNPSLGDSGIIPSTPPEAQPSAEASRGRALFSDAVRGFGRCSTCHEVNGVGISVATPISQVPSSVSAFRSLSTPQVSTALADAESMPALVVSNTKRAVIFYDLTTPPAVLRTFEPSAVTVSIGSSWRHASVVDSYSDTELAAILEYLGTVLKP